MDEHGSDRRLSEFRKIRLICGSHLQDIDFHAKLRKLSYSKLTDI